MLNHYTSTSHSVDLGFISLVESHQKTIKNVSTAFPAWHMEFKGCYGEPGKLAVVSFGKALNGTLPPLCGRQVTQMPPKMATPKQVWTSRPKDSDTICFLMNEG